MKSPTVAVLIPCYNEEVAIASVVQDFRRSLPDATIYVYDNNSTDRTASIARRHGAIVRPEQLQGKGNVVRRMFADVDADIYVMVDGDGTYDASVAPDLVECLRSCGADMVNAARIASSKSVYRPGHRFGNRVLTGLVCRIFGHQISDLLSGYRVFSRRYVKSFPALSTGFETETELTVHALDLRMPTCEVPTVYAQRPLGSKSKLNTFRDGRRILTTIIMLLIREKPFLSFAAIAIMLAITAVILAIPSFLTFAETELVSRLPTAVLSAAMMLVSLLSLSCGLVLDTVTTGRKEAKRLAYLRLPPPTSLNDSVTPASSSEFARREMRLAATSSSATTPTASSACQEMQSPVRV